MAISCLAQSSKSVVKELCKIRQPWSLLLLSFHNYEAKNFLPGIVRMLSAPPLGGQCTSSRRVSCIGWTLRDDSLHPQSTPFSRSMGKKFSCQTGPKDSVVLRIRTPLKNEISYGIGTHFGNDPNSDTSCDNPRLGQG